MRTSSTRRKGGRSKRRTPRPGKVAEDESIFKTVGEKEGDAKRKCDKDEQLKDAWDKLNEEKALKEQEEKAKAACDINAFKPMLQDSGSMIFSRGGSMERTSKEKKVFDCEGEANMLSYNGMLDRSARIKSGDKAEDGFDHNAFERMLQDFS